MNLNLNHLPTFELTLPISKEKITFRPFVMREEKLLLMASEADNYEDVVNAMNNSVNACTFGKVNCENYSMVDVQYLFLHVRGKSVGEVLNFSLICSSCKHNTPYQLNVNDFKVTEHPNHSNIVNITENLKVTMQYPKIRHLGILTNSINTVDDTYVVMAECIETIQTDSEVFNASNSTIQDKIDFIDNLTNEQFQKIEEFFTTMPALRHVITYTCKCDVENTVTLDDVVNFFV